MSKKSFKKCQVFMCQRPTRSGKEERDRAERYCRYHHPDHIAHLHRIRPNTNVSSKGVKQLTPSEHRRATDYDHAFLRAKLEMQDLSARIAARESAEAAALLLQNMRGDAPPIHLTTTRPKSET